ncbi:hypothetical protein IA57_09625 [Mangrovimonas yunxiaonensis]|uniref:Uncharacterized protein n=1 Tax=Mangrovimonas yunxiaonensis TaxID=1197477 RepID=A0A084TJ26_9FLAO|nr:hypothetical protein IA57_09625 [Mangrovimonas yunxiaonensis]
MQRYIILRGKLIAGRFLLHPKENNPLTINYLNKNFHFYGIFFVKTYDFYLYCSHLCLGNFPIWID